MPSFDADIVVIGSGPGGAVAACTLAEGGRDVLMLEEGDDYAHTDVEPFSLREMALKYRYGGIGVTRGKTRIAFAEGRCLGGGSEINSGLYHRTPADVLAAWQESHGVVDTDPAALEPHFAACERDLSVSLMPGKPPPISLRLHAGATALGWKSLEVPRWMRYGPNSAGEKQTMSRTFVPRLRAAGGRVVPGTKATRIRRVSDYWEVDVASGVDGRRRTSHVTCRSVFVACGATQTPLLLRRSGIRHRVGDSLRLHPTVKVVAEFADPVNSLDAGVQVHQVKEFAPACTFGCSISTPPFLAAAMLEQRAWATHVIEKWRHCAVYYAMIIGGAGSVREMWPFRDPLVRYALGTAEGELLAASLRRLCRCLLAGGATCIYPVVGGLPPVRSEDDLRLLPARLDPAAASLMTIHLYGSCPMGERRSIAAVDSYGRVPDVPGLLVSDASLFSGSLGVNPQGTVMAICRRNAVRFLERGSDGR